MKLGDNMAPIEACNAWNDVRPRKSRPPKIGDIPRHVAVDEESPGSSTSRSVGQVHEAVSTGGSKSMLERSTVSQSTEHGKSVASGTLPPVESFMKPRPSAFAKKVEEIPRLPGEHESSQRDETLKSSLNLNYSNPLTKSLNGACPIFNEINESSTVEKFEAIEELRKKSCVQALKSIGESILYEDEIPDEIIQVRKDSALYIDEKDNEAAELRDSLVAIGVGPRSNSGISHQHNVEDAVRLSGPRARRESSGYFSHLGTFDEERWNSSTVDLANQQETPLSTREALRERRRSSTKNRLPMGGGQQVNRMTTLVCPVNDDTTPLENDLANVLKAGRIEMPNIDEQSSLELNKSHEFDRNNDKKLHDVDGELGDRILQISLGNSTSKLKSHTDHLSNVPKVNETLKDVVETKELEIKSATVDLGTQWSTSHKTANRPRNRMVVHQYSSPNIVNTELSRIVERPHNAAENLVDVSSSTGELDEDDNEQVVVADLDGNDRSRDSDVDSRKLLPRSIKVYQLLSTQSEDRGDGDARLFDRRISLQIPRQEEEPIRGNVTGTPLPIVSTSLGCEYPEEKKLIHADSVPILKIPSSDAAGVENELRLCAGGRIPGSDDPSGPPTPGIRPIYPYCPYSPYASPQGSPRTNRRRPLRESRRVSIDSRQGALQLNQYKLLNNIGQGSYGIVKLAYNEEDETHYAMKILSKKKLMKKAGIFGRIAPGRKGVTNPLAKVYREIALLKKLDHPNVVKLVEVLDDPDEDNLYLVFELVQKGEVLQLPTDKPLDEETARIHFRDVVMGVEYLHYQRIVHRDIKPSNLLVDSEGRVKVADLGVSAELRAAGELLSGSAGTPAFAAPETTTPGAQYSGTLCDVWSMGVTLYSLVTGKVPWDGAGSIIGVQSAVRSEPLRFPDSPCFTEQLRDLVTRMLSKDPTRRITLAEIKEHPWLTNKGQEPLPNEVDNCRLPVTVTDEEVARVVTRVPKLDTLILIKTMLKQHSFQNPFLPKRIVKSGCVTGDARMSAGANLKQQVSSDTTDSSTELLPAVETLKSKTEQFHKAGRSNSAPDSYEWQTNGRQISSDSLLAPVTESSSQEQAEVEKR